MKINVNELHSSRVLMWSLLGIFIVVTLYALGVRTLVPPDEAATPRWHAKCSSRATGSPRA